MKTIEQNVKQKSRNPFKAVPWYGWVGAVVFVTIQLGFYLFSGWISKNFTGPKWGIHPKIDVIDSNIPYVPWFFIQIYYLSYLFWFIAPIVISTGEKQDFIDFMIYGAIASVIGFILFVFMPTWQIRNDDYPTNWKELLKHTPFTRFLVDLTWKLDGGETSYNMCPSYHCMASALCAYGVIKVKKQHIATQITFSVMAILVFLATVFVKQHYFLDVIGGISTATIPYVITRFWWKPGARIMKKYPTFLEIKHKDKKDKNESAKTPESVVEA